MINIRAFIFACVLWIYLIPNFSHASHQIKLRLITQEDLDPIVSYYSTNPVYELDYDWPSRGLKELLETSMSKQDQATYGILDVEPASRTFSQVIGFVRLKQLDTATPELLYTLDSSVWGKGIMTSAIKISLREVFKDPNVTGVFAKVFPRNKASARVLEKCGFIFDSSKTYTGAAMIENENTLIGLFRLSKDNFLKLENSTNSESLNRANK